MVVVVLLLLLISVYRCIASHTHSFSLLLTIHSHHTHPFDSVCYVLYIVQMCACVYFDLHPVDLVNSSFSSKFVCFSSEIYVSRSLIRFIWNEINEHFLLLWSSVSFAMINFQALHVWIFMNILINYCRLQTYVKRILFCIALEFDKWSKLYVEICVRDWNSSIVDVFNGSTTLSVLLLV